MNYPKNTDGGVKRNSTTRKSSNVALKKILLIIWKVPVTIIYFFPSIIIYLTPIRFLIVSSSDRIGHLAAEIDCFLKEISLGLRPRVKAVLLLSPRKTANNCLLQYWASRILVVRNSVLRKLLAPFRRFPYLRITLFETVGAIDQTATYPSVLAHWGSRPPLLTLSESHRARGETVLRSLGVPPGAWFVCVHSREGGYSPRDEHVHAHRNSDISSYRLAMEAIVERGGWCIRLGDPTMKPLSLMRGVIDYANSDQKSDWMDVFLCAQCRYFLGNSSGLYLLSTVFGVPAALANLTPMSGAYSVGALDLGIPMLLKWRSGETVPFAESLNGPVANLRRAEHFADHGIVMENNSPEEIKDLANEMIGRLDNVAVYSDDDAKLQDSFRGLFRPGHYTFGAASRVGRDFLRKYADLIPARPAPSSTTTLPVDQ